ncbi:hypothetical protein ACLOJK_037961 [Asimina triloba]
MAYYELAADPAEDLTLSTEPDHTRVKPQEQTIHYEPTYVPQAQRLRNQEIRGRARTTSTEAAHQNKDPWEELIWVYANLTQYQLPISQVQELRINVDYAKTYSLKQYRKTYCSPNKSTLLSTMCLAKESFTQYNEQCKKINDLFFSGSIDRDKSYIPGCVVTDMGMGE